jgi:alpha-galactosidase
MKGYKWLLTVTLFLNAITVSSQNKGAVLLPTAKFITGDNPGRQAQQIIKNDSCQVWVKELSDGSKAIGIFNMSNEYRNVSVNWKDLGLNNVQYVRDLWRQQDIGRIENNYQAAIPPHG